MMTKLKAHAARDILRLGLPRAPVRPPTPLGLGLGHVCACSAHGSFILLSWPSCVLQLEVFEAVGRPQHGRQPAPGPTSAPTSPRRPSWSSG
eukprot:10315320-Alexandrium_andersonii.AAC.1